MCPKSYLYPYDFSAYLHLCPFDRGRFCDEPVLCIFHPVPSRGTCFPTNSPFTPAWDVAPIRSASDMLLACRMSTPWSACLTRCRSCESSSIRTPVLLLAPGSNDTSAGYASSWNGRRRCREENRPRVELGHQGVGTGSSRTCAPSCT